jgi:hypothetical protein
MMGGDADPAFPEAVLQEFAVEKLAASWEVIEGPSMV